MNEKEILATLNGENATSFTDIESAIYHGWDKEILIIVINILCEGRKP